MRAALIAAALLLAPLGAGADTPPMTDDPYIPLEAAEGEPGLAFARAENARSLAVLQGDRRYARFYEEAAAIANASDRIPGAAFGWDGRLRNYWQDAQHVRGLWRRTTLDEYRKADIQWETLLDLDDLAKTEKANWVWNGVQCLAPTEDRCIISLTDGGKDARVLREFDLKTKTFVEDGFKADEAKQNYSWLDENTLFIARDWGRPGDMSTSGYPLVVKAWKRGTPLSAATEVFRGEPTDALATVFVLRDADGVAQATIGYRAINSDEALAYLLSDGQATPLPFPRKSSIQALLDGQLVFSLQQDWPEQNLKSGDLAAFVFDELKANPNGAKATLILRPTEAQSIEQVSNTRNRLLVALYENVQGVIVSYRHGLEGWTSRRLDLPPNLSVGISTASSRDDRMLVSASGFLTPSALWLADAASGEIDKIKTSPARFDASRSTVDQLWATSKDGTKVPYFVVRPKDLKYDGQAPTVVYAYGGFSTSMTPYYSGTTGKLWLENGGAYVVANIRGGAEFGPRWHQPTLKANRHLVYEDYFAVTEDLIARKITSPRRLGGMGGSNGGLLMGVALTERPELYNALVIQVPLLDMLRYAQIGAGASWISEYGDPAIPEERAFLARYSPYQNLKRGQTYPEVFLGTSTKDDRVTPAHARKMAARLKEYGYPYLYYENIDGGHAAAANLNEAARRQALEYTYLSRKLMD